MVLLVEASNGAFRAHEAEVNRALEPNSKPVPCHLHEERNSVAEPLSETVNSKASKSAIIKQSKRMYKCTKTEHVTQHVPAEFLLVSALLHSFIYKKTNDNSSSLSSCPMPTSNGEDPNSTTISIWCSWLAEILFI